MQYLSLDIEAFECDLSLPLVRNSSYTDSVSKPLQVLMPDAEMEEIKRLARRAKKPLGEWVRQALREVLSKQRSAEREFKLQAVRRAAKYSFPTAGVEQMLSKIDQGE
jgi:hypothetical protein